MLEKLLEGIGHALINQRAGMEQVVYNHLHAERETSLLTVTRSTFNFNGQLPVRYTADEEGISPPLAWDDCPTEAAAIAIIVEDADSPTPHPLVHAIAVDRDANDRSLAEGELSAPDRPHVGVDIGRNSFFEHGIAPCERCNKSQWI